jgi:hypothetical protein
VLYSALIAIAGFILGVRVGLGVGYRSERGRRITQERRWLGELARALGIRRLDLESVDAARARILDEARRRDAEPPAALPAGDPPPQT